jgi:ribosomal protein L11 methyltransferase
MRSSTGRKEKAADRPAGEDAKRLILKALAGRRMPLPDLLKSLPPGARLTRSDAKRAVRELIAAGDLTYSFEQGRSCLELSFDRPVRVSERIILTPPAQAVCADRADAVVAIAPGAAFGTGSHATTRLALRGIDFALSHVLAGRSLGGARALDIGTGSGVLVIAAVKLGIGRGEGTDLDPCAVSEARRNARLNGLDGQVSISDRPVETRRRPFALISANLRTPTLLRLAPLLGNLAEAGGAAVLSGIRPDERGEVLAACAKAAFECVRVEEEHGWTAGVLRKLSSESPRR